MNSNDRNDLNGKRLLVLGGGTAGLDVVRVAKSAGAYVAVADYYDEGAAKSIADKAYKISTVDFPALLEVIRDEKIDGVFSGPSEFNLKNAMILSGMAGLPFYTDEKQWEICSDKALFKDLCRRYGVPCIPEYEVTGEMLLSDLEKIRYPVMVKPVDASSSRGISVCFNEEDLKRAYAHAMECSVKGKVIVEKYVSNELAFSARYVINKGKAHLLLTNDRYAVDPEERKALICHVGVFPSSLSEKYKKETDPCVRRMFEELGLQNCALFLQALVDPDDGNIYFHEMGLRLSGGLTYTITEPITGVNDMLMMLRGAVGLDFSSDEEIAKIDPELHGKKAILFDIPLKHGKIGRAEGIENCLRVTDAVNYIQYYSPGDVVAPEKIGTLDQLFGRIKFVSDSLEDAAEKIDYINEHLCILDENGNDMIYRKFDTDKIVGN